MTLRSKRHDYIRLTTSGQVSGLEWSPWLSFFFAFGSIRVSEKFFWPSSNGLLNLTIDCGHLVTGDELQQPNAHLPANYWNPRTKGKLFDNIYPHTPELSDLCWSCHNVVFINLKHDKPNFKILVFRRLGIPCTTKQFTSTPTPDRSCWRRSCFTYFLIIITVSSNLSIILKLRNNDEVSAGAVHRFFRKYSTFFQISILVAQSSSSASWLIEL